MKCSNCAQFSDHLDTESNWELLNEDSPVAVHPLLKCCQCGHHQSLQ
jgi:hypothetical protein